MNTTFQAQTAIIDKSASGRDQQLASRRHAWNLFEKAFSRGRRNRWLSVITRKTVQLPCTPSISKAARHSTGIVVVQLTKIIGSEGRSQDFDIDFNPLNRHTRSRWIGIAAARDRGVVLPAVELIQIGDQYYVRDGHHRISVARAVGQLDIEARIVN